MQKKFGLLIIGLMVFLLLSSSIGQSSGGTHAESINDDFILKEIEIFQQELLQSIEGKSIDEVKGIYTQLINKLATHTGPFHRWPLEVSFAFQQFLLKHDLTYLVNNSTRHCLPDEFMIPEKDAIRTAENALISKGLSTYADLDSYYMSVDLCFEISDPDEIFWDVYYMTETPDASFPYFIRFIVRVEANTGEVRYIIPLDGNG